MARTDRPNNLEIAVPQNGAVNTRTLGSELRRARKALRLRQKDVALAVEVDRRRVSDWEKDAYHPDAEHRPKLASKLKLSLAMLDKLYVPPAKPYGGIADLFQIKKPDYQPTGDYSTAKRLRALYWSDKQLFKETWDGLNAREDRSEVRRFFKDVQTDVGDEALAWMRITLPKQLEPARLAPLRCGFRDLPVVHHEHKYVVGDCPVPAIVRKGERPGVIFVQISVMTKIGIQRPDGIVGVKVNGEMRWCATEFDGPGHDTRRDHEREEILQMRVVRFTPEDIRLPNFAETYWINVEKALGI